MSRIVLDTSALIAVLMDELEGARCIKAMSTDEPLLISAGTLAEAKIVAGRRNARAAFDRLIARLKPEIIQVTAGDADPAADAYDWWGKGVHPAALNFGDCFAYALAKTKGWPLLFLGNDFAQTDVIRA